MSIFRIKTFVSCLVAASLLMSVVHYGSVASNIAAASEVESIQQSDVLKQARIWVDELSAEARYSAWRQAKLSVSALGPGMHSWLVQLQDKHTIVGYLVIHATVDGGFQLGEYGTGSYPLFNEQSLQFSLLQLDLPQYKAERVYGDALHAAWRITAKQAVYYADAMSGESLPIADDLEWQEELGSAFDPDEKKHGLPASHAKLSSSFGLIASFDPYGRMPWLTKQPLIPEAPRYSSLLQAIKNKKQLRYTTESYKGKLRQVWSVVGYDLWDGDQLFLALDSDEDESDRRYLPVTLLLAQGKFSS